MSQTIKTDKTSPQSSKSLGQKKTYSVKPSEITRQWHLINAKNVPLGRLSTEISKLLVGKHKPQYSAHIDCGDYVVVINSAEVGITGKKVSQKTYYRHSQYPGSIKAVKLGHQLEISPDKVIYKAVQGMLPKNKLQSLRLKRLKIYSTADHDNQAQKPVEHNIALKHETKLEQ